MIQEQHWLTGTAVLITDEPNQGSVHLDIPEDNSYIQADAYIFRLWVSKDYRRHGTAKALMETAEDEARRRGCKTVSLGWDKREAQQWTYDWYVRMGYHEVEFGKNSALLRKELADR